MSRTLGPYNPFRHNADSGGFNALSLRYKANPSIALYVDLRRKYPKALVEVATSHSMEWLFSNGETLKSYGIDPDIVAGCLDAASEDIQELCLLLMENLLARDALESEGVAHIQSQDGIMPDSLINYLISMMLDALDWNDDLFIPRDLIVLIKHRFGADISAEKRKQDVKDKRTKAIWMAAHIRADGQSLSMRDVAKEMGVSPSTVLRWFPDGDFESSVERVRSIVSSPEHKKMMLFGQKFREEKAKSD
ncbi:MAG: hypothetical protein ACSHXY_02825 [Alphaproteobacteria bacterium]